MVDSTGTKKSTQSSFHELMSMLHSEFERIQTDATDEPDRRHLVDILADGINKSLKEIRMGADVYEFKESAVIHTIVDGAREGYSGTELKNFVKLLSDEDMDDDIEDSL